MPPRSALAPVYFGKLPSRGDFVRHNAGRPSVRAFDDWIQHGLHAAKKHRDFKSTFDAAPARCFFFSPREVPGALIGVMRPSRDRSGRRYPFVIALDAGGRALPPQRTAHVPVQLRAFFDQALALTRRAIAGRVDLQDLLDALPPTPPPGRRSDNAAMRGYKRFLRRTQVQAFWKQLWNGCADADTDERKQRLVGNLIEVLHPLQAHVPARFSLGMQFPLSAADADTDAYTASFWWDTCLRLLRFPDVAPTCFWTLAEPRADEHTDGDNASEDEPTRETTAAQESGSMLLFLRPPYARTFAHLFPNGQESDHVYVLDRHGAERAARAAQDAPPRYGTLLDGRPLTLWNLLKQLD